MCVCVRARAHVYVCIYNKQVFFLARSFENKTNKMNTRDLVNKPTMASVRLGNNEQNNTLKDEDSAAASQ